jgi:hypothetical protein
MKQSPGRMTDVRVMFTAQQGNAPDAFGADDF